MITTAEAAVSAGVSPCSVSKWALEQNFSGAVKTVRGWLIPEDAFSSFLAEREAQLEKESRLSLGRLDAKASAVTVVSAGPWTPEEDALILSMAGKRTLGEIAAALGRSVHQVYVHAGKMGVGVGVRGGARPRTQKREDDKIVTRLCHDCGKNSYGNYRCSKCLAKWRERYHVTETDVEQWADLDG